MSLTIHSQYRFFQEFYWILDHIRILHPNPLTNTESLSHSMEEYSQWQEWFKFWRQQPSPLGFLELTSPINHSEVLCPHHPAEWTSFSCARSFFTLLQHPVEDLINFYQNHPSTDPYRAQQREYTRIWQLLQRWEQTDQQEITINLACPTILLGPHSAIYHTPSMTPEQEFTMTTLMTSGYPCGRKTYPQCGPF